VSRGSRCETALEAAHESKSDGVDFGGASNAEVRNRRGEWVTGEAGAILEHTQSQWIGFPTKQTHPLPPAFTRIFTRAMARRVGERVRNRKARSTNVLGVQFRSSFPAVWEHCKEMRRRKRISFPRSCANSSQGRPSLKTNVAGEAGAIPAPIEI